MQLRVAVHCVSPKDTQFQGTYVLTAPPLTCVIAEFVKLRMDSLRSSSLFFMVFSSVSLPVSSLGITAPNWWSTPPAGSVPTCPGSASPGRSLPTPRPARPHVLRKHVRREQQGQPCGAYRPLRPGCCAKTYFTTNVVEFEPTSLVGCFPHQPSGRSALWLRNRRAGCNWTGLRQPVRRPRARRPSVYRTSSGRRKPVLAETAEETLAR